MDKNTYQKMNNIVKQQVKKLASVTLLVGAFLGAANAQSETGITGGQSGVLAEGQVSNPVKLNVVLKPVRTLVVSGSEVNLVYKTVEDYQNGVSYTTDNGHLQVTNIGGGYKIYVKSSSRDLTHSSGSTIDGGGVTVEGIAGSHGRAYNRKVSEIHDNASNGVELFHVDANEAKGKIATAFNVKYSAAGNGAYNNKVVNNQSTTYTVDLMYTILTD